MRTREIVEIATAARVTEEVLEECHALLSEVAAQCGKAPKVAQSEPVTFSPSYTAILIDQAKVKFESFEELTQYSNRKDRRIIQLTAKLEPEFLAPLKVDIEFGRASAAFLASVDGEEAAALQVKERCKDIASRARVSYGWMYSNWTMVVYIVLWLISGALAGLAIGNRLTGGDATALISLIGPGLVVVLWLSATARAKLFPRMIFELGQEQARSDGIKSVRRWVLTTLVLGIPVAILVRFIASTLGM
jgi:hypothetical protein